MNLKYDKNLEYFVAIPGAKNMEVWSCVCQLALIGKSPNWKCATDGILGWFDYSNFGRKTPCFEQFYRKKCAKSSWFLYFGYFPLLITCWVVVCEGIISLFHSIGSLQVFSGGLSHPATFIIRENTRIIAGKGTNWWNRSLQVV